MLEALDPGIHVQSNKDQQTFKKWVNTSNTMHVCWIGTCKNSDSYGSRAVPNGKACVHHERRQEAQADPQEETSPHSHGQTQWRHPVFILYRENMNTSREQEANAVQGDWARMLMNSSLICKVSHTLIFSGNISYTTQSSVHSNLIAPRL